MTNIYSAKAFHALTLWDTHHFGEHFGTLKIFWERRALWDTQNFLGAL